MPSLDETLNGGPLHDALLAGIADISQHQTVCFTTYQKVILPLDGFVFWLRQGTFEATGALHFMTERQQNEDDTSTKNSVVFTTAEQVQPLNQRNTQQLVVGSVEGRSFAFSRTGWFFEPASIWHYQGESLDPATATQLVDDPAQLDPDQLIVSDSLPAWLALASFTPDWLVPANPGIPLYPSYLVPDNIEPPWGAVHIEPEGIRALQPIPLLDPRTATHTQLTSERVRITLYGCNNAMAADFLDTVISYSYNYDVIGIMGAGPTIRDDKRRWVEGMTLAQKKLIDFEVSYIQTRINSVARQLILDAQCAVMTPYTIEPKICIDGVATVFCDATAFIPQYNIIAGATVTVAASVLFGPSPAVHGAATVTAAATQVVAALTVGLEDGSGQWSLEDGTGGWVWG